MAKPPPWPLAQTRARPSATETKAGRLADGAHLETELKFQVPGARAQALRRAVATRSAQTTRLQAVYAETADQRLAAAGLALRLRKEGRVWVQTLKGRGDGLMNRVEHERRLPPRPGVPQLDVQRHAGTPAGEALFAALANKKGEPATLAPLYRTDIQRLHRRVRTAGALIEIAYDSGHIFAGEAGNERSAVVDEIEFELISGPPAALLALAERWVQRFDLWWDSRTKSERGLRLALGLTHVPAVRSTFMPWPESVDCAGVWQSAVQSALMQAVPNAAEIASGTHKPEHLHQLRVALRRLRTSLRLLGAWGGVAEQAQALEAAWRVPFGALGAARDADVQAQGMRPRLAAAGAPDFAWPAPVALVDPGQVVRGHDFTVLLLRSLALAQVNGPTSPSSLHEAAAALLQAQWRQLRKDAAAFAQAEPAAQHRTRKRLKRFRYVLDSLLPLFKRRPAQRLLKAVCRALDALGELNDLQTAQALCRTQTTSDAQAWFAVGWLAAREEPAMAAAVEALAALTQVQTVWRR
jgi:triphosphatase